jgi:hypothetical protein
LLLSDHGYKSKINIGKISDYDDVVAVEGDYTEAITGLGPLIAGTKLEQE